MANDPLNRSANRSYPTPGQASTVDGISVRITGDEAMRQRLLNLGVAFPNRVERLLEVVTGEIAAAANAAAHRSKRTFKGRPGGRLARSFAPYPRPQWLKYGLVGMVVRSKAKYHWYQEFGVNRPDVQVLRYRDAAGKKVSRGQGEGRRFREGTNRLNVGVFVSSSRRDIIVPARPILGPVFRRMKSQVFSDIETGIKNYLSRAAAGAP